MKAKVINSILMDDLKRAEMLIAKNPEGFEMLSNLLKKVKDKPFPLKEQIAREPKSLGILTSYTCGFRCEMCSSGFSDRTDLFDEYKYFLPEQFEKLSFWINSASHITFVGLGETFNSPYLNSFLKKIVNKHSTIYTNGIPLNRKKIQPLINNKLNCLLLSFDGKLSIGHGKGKEKYIQQFWEKVKLIQGVKKDFKSRLPVVKLTVVVARENIDNLDEIIENASKHGINHVMLSLMTPINEKMYHESVFVKYNESKRKINSILYRWNRKGVLVTVIGYRKKLWDSFKVCPFIDNWLHFHGRKNTLGVCCGSLEVPVYFSGTLKIDHWNSFPSRYLRYLHYCSNRKELPNACKNCRAVHFKKFSKRCAFLYNQSKNKKEVNYDPQSLYSSASMLKQNNQIGKVEKMYLEILKLKPDPELKGKIYFHLGEIQLQKKEFRQALCLMKLSVQHCFNHGMAFAYLYLLIMFFGKKKRAKRRRKFKIVVPE